MFGRLTRHVCTYSSPLSASNSINQHNASPTTLQPSTAFIYPKKPLHLFRSHTTPSMSAFSSTLIPPLASFPSLNPPSIAFSFALPPTDASSQTYASSPSSSSHPYVSRLPRGPHPRVRQTDNGTRHAAAAAHRRRAAGGLPTSAGGDSGERSNLVRSRNLGSGSGGGYHRTGNSGVERALEGRLPFGMDLAREELDLSEEELDLDLKVIISR